MRGRIVRPFATVALVAGLVGAPQLVHADTVSNAEARLQHVLDALYALQDQMNKLDVGFGNAQDQKAGVDADIAATQKRVDALQAQVGGVQEVLQNLAVTRFTSGGSTALSPLFNDATTYSNAEQRDALGRLALDTGETRIDDLQAVMSQLGKQQVHLQRMRSKAKNLIGYLSSQQKKYESLQSAYQSMYSKAKRELGAAKLQAAEDARIAAAAARARRVAGYTGGGVPADAAGGGAPARGSVDRGVGDPTPSAPVTTPPSGRAGIAVRAAYSQLGVPYRYAGATPGVAFDCSGLTMWAWGLAGVSMSHGAQAQFDEFPHIPISQARPGDLLFSYSPIGHVGIYVGGGLMIHAPYTGAWVSLRRIDWSKIIGVSRPG
jgi:cell wall-associated NlpC family hydrolase